MKVCAHINYGPFVNGHERFDTVAKAKEYFQSEVIDSPFIHGTTDESDGCYVMDLYEQCGQCDSAMNFHDYPMARYDIGPRGGMRKVAV